MGVLDESAGCFLVAAFLACALTGITSSQAFTYYRSSNDGPVIFWLVTTILIMAVIHTAITCVTPYIWLVTNFGNPSVLLQAPWSFAIEPFMTGIVGLLVQSFYAHKLFLVGGRKYLLPTIVMVLSAVQVGFSFGATLKVFLVRDFAQFSTWTYGVVTWLVAAALADVIITVALVYYLRNAKKSDYAATNSIIDKLLRNIISTNGLTTVLAIVNAGVFAAIPEKGFYVPLNIILLNLYFNSLLVTLNSRGSTASALKAQAPRQTGSLAVNVKLANLSNIGESSMTSLSGRTSKTPIRVETVQEVKVDSSPSDDEDYSTSQGKSRRSKTGSPYDMELGNISPRLPARNVKESTW